MAVSVCSGKFVPVLVLRRRIGARSYVSFIQEVVFRVLQKKISEAREARMLNADLEVSNFFISVQP